MTHRAVLTFGDLTAVKVKHDLHQPLFFFVFPPSRE